MPPEVSESIPRQSFFDHLSPAHTQLSDVSSFRRSQGESYPSVSIDQQPNILSYIPVAGIPNHIRTSSDSSLSHGNFIDPFEISDDNATSKSNDRGFGNAAAFDKFRGGDLSTTMSQSSPESIFHRQSEEENYQCASEKCLVKETIWPTLSNFRQHINHMHKEENIRDLIERSLLNATPMQPNSFLRPGEVTKRTFDRMFSGLDAYSIRPPASSFPQYTKRKHYQATPVKPSRSRDSLVRLDEKPIDKSKAVGASTSSSVSRAQDPFVAWAATYELDGILGKDAFRISRPARPGNHDCPDGYQDKITLSSPVNSHGDDAGSNRVPKGADRFMARTQQGLNNVQAAQETEVSPHLRNDLSGAEYQR